jgi:hypothetical protein
MNKPYLFQSLFIVNVFICLFRLETGLCTPISHSPAVLQTSIELVINNTPGHLSFYLPATTQTDGYVSANDAVIPDYAYTMDRHEFFAIQLIRSFSSSRIAPFGIVSMLQKCSIWHQAPTDAPSYLG